MLLSSLPVTAEIRPEEDLVIRHVRNSVGNVFDNDPEPAPPIRQPPAIYGRSHSSYLFHSNGVTTIVFLVEGDPRLLRTIVDDEVYCLVEEAIPIALRLEAEALFQIQLRFWGSLAGVTGDGLFSSFE